MKLLAKCLFKASMQYHNSLLYHPSNFRNHETHYETPNLISYNIGYVRKRQSY